MSNNDLISFSFIRHEERDTQLAYCVSEEEDTFEKEAKRIFLSKSKCEYNEAEDVFEVPGWLAFELELI